MDAVTVTKQGVFSSPVLVDEQRETVNLGGDGTHDETGGVEMGGYSGV